MLPLRRISPAPRARRAAALATALLATGGLTACTAEQNAQSNDLTGVQGEVQDTIERFSDLADQGRAATICDEILGEQLRTALGGADCTAGVKKAIDNADYTNLNVDKVDVDAAKTTAVATIKPVEDADQRRALTLTRTDAKGRWTIAALDPTGKTKLPSGGTTPATTPAGTTPAETTPGSTPKE